MHERDKWMIVPEEKDATTRSQDVLTVADFVADTAPPRARPRSKTASAPAPFLPVIGERRVPWDTSGAYDTTMSLGCNPVDGECACLEKWHGGKPCEKDVPKDLKPVHIAVGRGSWVLNPAESPLPLGLHRCRRSMCNVSAFDFNAKVDYNAYLITWPVDKSSDLVPLNFLKRSGRINETCSTTWKTRSSSQTSWMMSATGAIATPPPSETSTCT